MSDLSQQAVKNYREKQAFIPNVNLQGARSLLDKGIHSGKGFLGSIKPWFIPSIPDLRQFESYMHTPMSQWMKRDIGSVVDPVTGQTRNLHGFLAHNFGLRYGQGMQEELMHAAMSKRNDLMKQVHSGKRSLPGSVYDFFAGPLTKEKIIQQYERELDFANRMGASTSVGSALQNLKGPTVKNTLRNVGNFASKNAVTGLTYALPGLMAYDIVRNPDPNSSRSERFGELAGGTLGGALTFPLGLVGGTVGGMTGANVGRFLGKQVNKAISPSQPYPQVQGYNPPVMHQMPGNVGYNNPYNSQNLRY